MTEQYKRFFEMANLTKADTGLNYRIWISTNTGKEKHWARIKVEVDNEFIPISIEDNPQIKVKSKQNILPSKDLEMIILWIVKNKQLLLDYWNSKGEMSLKEFFKKMKKIKK